MEKTGKMDRADLAENWRTSHSSNKEEVQENRRNMTGMKEG